MVPTPRSTTVLYGDVKKRSKVPIGQSDDGSFCESSKYHALLTQQSVLTIIDIIKVQVRVIWVIDDHRASEPVTILR